MDISAKVNVIVQLEFELAHFEAAVQHFSHNILLLSLFYQLKSILQYLLSMLEILSFSFLLVNDNEIPYRIPD